jgi:small subunit ribosomal protein S1
VDLGGVDGLVHVSELSWKHIDHPGEIVEVGQEVEVEVLDVDLERERVSLSLKATQEDPWRQFARQHYVGEFIEGNVTKLVPFGAFVKVEEGIEGLIHISELAEAHVEVPEQVVKVNDPITVKIIDIDDARRRISLSLKQAVKAGFGEEPEIEQEPQYSAAGGAPEGEVTSTMGAAFAEAFQQRAGTDEGTGEGTGEGTDVSVADVVAELRDQVTPEAPEGDPQPAAEVPNVEPETAEDIQEDVNRGKSEPEAVEGEQGEQAEQ